MKARSEDRGHDVGNSFWVKEVVTSGYSMVFMIVDVRRYQALEGWMKVDRKE